MVTRLCGQILLEDLKASRKHDILQWTEVPEKIKQQLEKQEFDPLCKKEEEADKKAGEGEKTTSAAATTAKQTQQPGK
jgi:hypothetical protein